MCNTSLKKKVKKLAFFFKNKLLVRWIEVYKKKLENFPIFCPIWNFSDQYFSVIHLKRVRRLFKKIFKSLHYFFLKTRFWCGRKTSIKKTLGKFYSIRPFWKLFGNIFFFLIKSVLDVLKKPKRNTPFFLQYKALLETFRTFFFLHQKQYFVFIKGSVLNN